MCGSSLTLVFTPVRRGKQRHAQHAEKMRGGSSGAEQEVTKPAEKRRKTALKSTYPRFGLLFLALKRGATTNYPAYSRLFFCRRLTASTSIIPAGLDEQPTSATQFQNKIAFGELRGYLSNIIWLQEFLLKTDWYCCSVWILCCQRLQNSDGKCWHSISTNACVRRLSIIHQE